MNKVDGSEDETAQISLEGKAPQPQMKAKTPRVSMKPPINLESISKTPTVQDQKSIKKSAPNQRAVRFIDLDHDTQGEHAPDGDPHLDVQGTVEQENMEQTDCHNSSAIKTASMKVRNENDLKITTGTAQSKNSDTAPLLLPSKPMDILSNSFEKKKRKFKKLLDMPRVLSGLADSVVASTDVAPSPLNVEEVKADSPEHVSDGIFNATKMENSSSSVIVERSQVIQGSEDPYNPFLNIGKFTDAVF